MFRISATKPLNNPNPPGLLSSVSPSSALSHLIKVGLASKASETGRLHLELFSCHWTIERQTADSKKLQSSPTHPRADGLISLAGWTPSCRWSPRRFGRGVMSKLPPRHPALHQSGGAFDVRNGSTMGKKHGSDRSGRPEGLPVVYLSNLGNCLLPIPLLSSLGVFFFWLAVFSLLQSFLNFTVRFGHQRFNHMCSLHKQLFWLGDFLCTQINYTACFWGGFCCSETTTYIIQNIPAK